MNWTAADLPDLHGRTAIVTGANSGIGWNTALGLATHGARVVLACRDVEKGKQAADRIRSDVPAAELDVAEVDLGSMQSVRGIAAAFDGPIDMLINNAGVMAPLHFTCTRDGFELQFGTNHLAHFALTGLLLPQLLSAPKPRVVTVASIAHRRATRAVLAGNANPADYRPKQAYANSKLANLLFAAELQRRAEAHGVRLTSTAAHPGLAGTSLVSDKAGLGANPVLRTFGPAVFHAISQSAEAGARPTLYAAAVAEPGSYSGPQLLGETRGALGPASWSPLARDRRLAHDLWRFSEDMTGLHYAWP